MIKDREETLWLKALKISILARRNFLTKILSNKDSFLFLKSTS